jgi:four helix bundle protein
MDFYFDHERLKVYHVARRFNRELHTLLGELPRGHADSKDNLKRGGMSITRNIAEGSGRWRIPDKVHFYHMARASATECSASLDELVDFEVVPPERIILLQELAAQLVAMLIAMIRSLEERGGTTMGG